MGRVVYGALGAAGSITTAGGADEDIWGLVASSTGPIKLLGFEITSSAIAAALVVVRLVRLTANGTGTAAVEEEADEKMGTPTATLITDAATASTEAGTLMTFQWEQLGPLGHIFTPEMAPVALVTDGFALNLVTAATITLSGYVCWEEMGA